MPCNTSIPCPKISPNKCHKHSPLRDSVLLILSTWQNSRTTCIKSIKLQYTGAYLTRAQRGMGKVAGEILGRSRGYQTYKYCRPECRLCCYRFEARVFLKARLVRVGQTAPQQLSQTPRIVLSKQQKQRKQIEQSQRPPRHECDDII